MARPEADAGIVQQGSPPPARDSAHHGLRFQALRGGELGAQIDALAALRIRVFRDWPYLYEGSLDYERQYLQTYCRSARSLAVLVWDGDLCIGATTTLPLADAGADAQRPFLDSAYDIGQIDYFGESILLPEYRGRGLGVRFFELREAHARELGLGLCAFCAVERPEQHPAKPSGYLPNDTFWTHRGYRKAPGIVTHFDWPDTGEKQSTAKPMSFWLKRLEGTA